MAEREYVRDDSGRFSETPGGGGGGLKTFAKNPTPGPSPAQPKTPALSRAMKLYQDKEYLKREVETIKDLHRGGILKNTPGQQIKVAKTVLAKQKETFPHELARLNEIAKEVAPDGVEKVYGRVKTLESTIGKLSRKPVRVDETTGVVKGYKDANDMQDITGMTVVLKTRADQVKFIEAMRSKGKVVAEDDYVNNPQGGIYRAHHMIIKGSDGHDKELQIKTKRQVAFSMWMHPVYKPTNPKEMAAAKANAKELHAYAKQAADHYAAKDLGGESPGMPPCTRVVKDTFGCLDDI